MAFTMQPACYENWERALFCKAILSWFFRGRVGDRTRACSVGVAGAGRHELDVPCPAGGPAFGAAERMGPWTEQAGGGPACSAIGSGPVAYSCLVGAGGMAGCCAR